MNPAHDIPEQAIPERPKDLIGRPREAAHRSATIVGAGPLGAFFAARISALGADVHLLARTRPYAYTWLHVKSTEWTDFSTYVFLHDNPEEVPETDICLVVVPLQELAAMTALPAAPIVVSLCNGIDGRDRVQAIEPSRDVIYGVTTATVESEGPGRVVQYSHGHRITLSDGTVGGTASRAALLLRTMGLDAINRTDGKGEAWRKAAFVLPIAAACIRYRGTIGDVRADPERWRHLVAASDEILALGELEGVPSNRNQRDWDYRRVPRKMQPSTARRVLEGDIGEWDLLLEPVFAVAEKHGHPLLAFRALTEPVDAPI